MLLDSSLEEGLNSLYHLYMDSPPPPSSSSPTLRLAPSSTFSSQISKTQSQGILITTPPELRLRNPVPEPQNAADCSQADQSASQAIQQASQQASQSIQQASQSASQASQQAAQSASNAIQQFSNSASQSIAAASRSVSSAVSSASAAVASASSQIASIQSSASAAVSRANGSMVNAQASVTLAQAQASSAVMQAGAAVAAATGSAAAAGSSFLAAASKATQSAQASVSAIGAQASQQVSQASQQVTASQNAAVTATQAALAIVGSIIASALITILIFFLVARHKKAAKRKRGDPDASLGNVYFSDPKFPISEQAATTAVPSQPAYTGNRDVDPMSGSQVTFSLFPRAGDEKPTAAEKKKNEELRRSIVKSTTVPWNPNKPPKAPTLGSWLKLQDGVSPFGPIKLPLDDEKSGSPLGGQLKSPMTTKPIVSPRMSSRMPIPIRSPGLPPNRSPKLPVLMNEPISVAGNASTITAVPKSPLTQTVAATSPKKPDTLPQHSTPGPEYRESKASVWTDDIPDPSPSPPLQSPPPELRGKRSLDRRPINSMQKVTNMEIPTPVNTVRNTAEWFAERNRMDFAQRDSRVSQSQYQPQYQPKFRPQYGNQSSAYVETSKNNRPSFGLPRGPRLGAGMGLPSRPGPSRQIRSSEAEAGYVQGLNRFLPDGRLNDRGSLLSRMGSDRSANASTPGGKSVLNTPGVGKAL
ncbi:uncharacterized protein LY89DRAFT_731651 [Mollisia scopiformis]|uniref:Uncharacterized protein n=1 Tax=Mollisia scopiformis TaxID=149040 RepID=A0A194XHI9_MOLSC|nr:uncharacterized protein LY89DRAFT_731651 [Mollisia scopiformis]KUJ19242.1 hypothetical protein LY89DRAFT_731651 [Mollisia scopiformis]